jgi:molybdate transport system substrate-binding protein
MRNQQRRFIALLLGLTVTLGLFLSACTQGSPTVSSSALTNSVLTVSAASSLSDALKEIVPLYQQTQKTGVQYNFASSGDLQQQIENGAPVDVFISAAAKQMNALQQKSLIVSDTRRNLLSNRMVLITSKNVSGINRLEDLKKVEVSKIAIGDPKSVPIGQYAEQALKKQALWEILQSKFVLANNVRQVLQFVESGNAQAGLVYITDAKTTNQVKVVQTIPADLHDPIVYPIAVIQASKNQASSRELLQFLSGEQAKQVFVKYGFEMA